MRGSGRARAVVTRVVLLGPAPPRRGATASALPVRLRSRRRSGESTLDAAAVARLSPAAGGRNAATHAQEHSLEVQLPFLQRCSASSASCRWSSVRPAPRQVAQVLERLWGGDETLIVISSDLSHYLPYDTARPPTAPPSQAHPEAFDPGLATHQACGATPIDRRAAGGAPPRPGAARCSTCAIPATPRASAIASSATARSRSRSSAPGTRRSTVGRSSGSRGGVASALKLASGRTIPAPRGSALRATFVTLRRRRSYAAASVRCSRAGARRRRRGERGCGRLRRPAVRAAGRDELDQVEIEVSLLSVPPAVPFADDARARRHAPPRRRRRDPRSGGRRGTFLPQVWEQLPDPASSSRASSRRPGCRPTSA